MNDEQLRANDDFLAAAVAWVRAALTGDDSARELRGRVDALRDGSAFGVVARSFDLSPFEQWILLLCIAHELDTRIGPLCARAANDPARPFPTFALAMNLFDAPHWDALSPEGPLRKWRLIETQPFANQPLIAASLRADERVLSAIKGLTDLDERIAAITSAIAFDDAPLAQAQVDILDQIARAISSAAGRVPIVQLAGTDNDAKRAMASHLAQALGASLHALPKESLPAHAADVATMARLWTRECLLTERVLLVDAHDATTTGLGEADKTPDGTLTSLRHFLSGARGIVLVDVRDALPRMNAETAVFDVDKPGAHEQRAAWAGAFDEATAAQFASQFNFGLGAIKRIAASARDANDAWRASLSYARPKLDQLAQRVDAKATWGDIVLPEEQVALLRQIAAQVRHRSRVYGDWGFAARLNRGLGITALFAGDSGTGKTMAAEVLAIDLGLNLFRIDLSAVVSKYIGESEKNLRRLFDAAEDGGSILLFDEADALFGKRSEVKDSHDRYANIEVNYLLQRMEAFRGLAILATNMKSSLDTAFMRRLRFVVQFPYPAARERTLIWQKAFPRATPLAALDFDRLARFNLSGGNIQGIALNAAFLAAQNGGVVAMAHVLAATRSELVKLERGVNERDFEP